ncbi:proteasome assembly chaperone family protein [Natrialba taiwanensis]|uniref:Proteasome assembly chaperone family protein n=1 Tax=Natrialba taiwanensis DSM 12281 TaxID=1230458 RepID=L9ZP82_9EURY|nr:PAC2 family protein [Natrialba taiwanensis]ELY88315.1 hypothetical protein C484_15417 [Natrialba taiwanensis DSM 12281]
MATDPQYELVTSATDRLEGPLFLALPNIGLTGLTAADYLVQQLEFDQIGYARTRNLPTVVPFRNGELRRPIRLYASDNADCCVLLSETIVPVWTAGTFVDAVVGWLAETEIDELAVLHGLPFQHGPVEHEVFTVATSGFRRRRLADTDDTPLGGGILDGVPGELATRQFEGDVPPIGVLVTPNHPPGPDLDAALRYLTVLAEWYDLEIDTEPLRERSEALTRYYAELAERMAAMESPGHPARGTDASDDRMYM